MLRILLIAVLSIGIAGTAYWGYREHQQKNAVLIHAENNYQRAFHDLTYQIDLIHDQIGTTLAMNSRQSLSPALAEVWRLSSEAHATVGQLPLSLLPFNKTEEFLANIGTFSYRTAIRDLEKEPLNKEEYATLQKLYKKSAEIQQELRNVQHLVLQNNLRWMDVELALATNQKPNDNTIIDGFKTVEKNVQSYKETDFGPTFTGAEKGQKGFEHLEGKNITEKEAKQIAKTFLGLKGNEKITVTRSDGFYSVTVSHPKKKSETYMDITKKGGHPIWVIENRPVKKQNLSVNEATMRGLEFLKKHQFKNLELYESVQYDNIAVLTFVTNENGIRIYPEAIKMKIALDNGHIIGFSARDYLSSHTKRQVAKPTLSVAEARAKINPSVQIMEERKSIILNDLNKEVLCYEFLGTLGDDTYRIFINAENGIEEKVEKLQNPEPIYGEI
jgi:spore germination protein